MSLLVARDRVSEIVTSPGSASFAFAGATDVSYMAFADADIDGAFVPYAARHRTSGQWETGVGLYDQTSDTLERYGSFRNSNGAQAKIDFSAGVVDVWIDATADKVPLLDATSNDLPLPASLIPASLTPLQAVFTDSAKRLITLPTVINVMSFGAVGDGDHDDTAAIQEARDAAGTNGTILFPDGTYLTTGLAANVAGQTWLLAGGATIKLKASTVAAVVVVSAADVAILGRGALDGNRANQASASCYGVSIVNGGDRCQVGDGLTIRNCLGHGLTAAATAGQTIAGLTVRRCILTGNGTASANQAQIYILIVGGTLTDLSMEDLNVDGTTYHNGGIKVQATSGGTIRRIRFDFLRIKVGDASSTDTLGLEFFTDSTSFISGIVGGIVEVTGENNTNAHIFGVSFGGTAGTADTTGIHDVAISAIRVQDCRQCALEVIASNVTVSSVTAKGSGRLHVDGSGIDGGVHDIAIGEYVSENCSHTSYAFLVGGDSSHGVTRLTAGRMCFYNPAGPVIVLGASGVNAPLSHIQIGQVLGSGLPSAGMTVGGVLTDSIIVDADFDLTGATGSVDGITLNNTGIARVRFRRLRIKGAPRYGFLSNVVVADVEVIGAYITACTSDGFRTAGGTGWVLDDVRADSNGGTGIILATSPAVKRMINCRALSNTTAQINKGTATFSGTPRGNQYSAGASSGRAVLVGGTVTVNTAEVLAADNILLNAVVTGGTPGDLSIGTIVAGTSFVINSTNGADTSTIFWEIVH